MYVQYPDGNEITHLFIISRKSSSQFSVAKTLPDVELFYRLRTIFSICREHNMFTVNSKARNPKTRKKYMKLSSALRFGLNEDFIACRVRGPLASQLRALRSSARYDR